MEDTLIMDAVINKYFAGETSDREEQFLMAWLEESEEHRKYFFELKSIWNAATSSPKAPTSAGSRPSCAVPTPG